MTSSFSRCEYISSSVIPPIFFQTIFFYCVALYLLVISLSNEQWWQIALFFVLWNVRYIEQFEQVQKKLEDFSTIHEENSNLKVDKLQLENEVSKLRYDNMACQVLKKVQKSDFQSILWQKLNRSPFFHFRSRFF